MCIQVATDVDSCDADGCAAKKRRIEHLLDHRLTHSGHARPFACTHCEQRFKTRGSLQAHVRCHTGTVKPSMPAADECWGGRWGIAVLGIDDVWIHWYCH